MAELAAPTVDKSPKGSVDAPILPLLDLLNSHPNYFTTSSCSGRISILHSNTNTINKKKKAGGGTWILVTHDPAVPDSVVDLLFHGTQGSGGELVFRFEPLIIAIDCRDVAAAQALVSMAISSGFRESGITHAHKRVMVAIRCSIRMEVPLGQMGHILVSQDYVRYLVDIANEKMEANRKRTNNFFDVLSHKGLPGSLKETNFGKLGRNEMITGQVSVELESSTDNYATRAATLDTSSLRPLDQDYILSSAKRPIGYIEEKGISNLYTKQLEEPNHDYELKPEYTDMATEMSKTPGCSLSATILEVIGEPVEKLFLWGQSACILNKGGKELIFIFGGFGGIGRHARRDDMLLLDPCSGLLSEVKALKRPSSRLGHTTTVVGNNVFVIGGRAGPSDILNDVWLLKDAEEHWSFLNCSGSSRFTPRHRHATTAVGSNIYVHGGLNNEELCSSMYILNTDTLQWSEVSIDKEWPCARHSHSLVACGHKLFMFGGYDGSRALNDLYSFDVRTLQWSRVKVLGRVPYPRFSHAMFIHKDFLGIIGGCPVRQQFQEMCLLNLNNHVWLHININSLGRELWVRSSTCVIDDELIIVGGGASCYAFGTKFSPPLKINLHILGSLCNTPCESEKHLISTAEVSVVRCLHSSHDLPKDSKIFASNHQVHSNENGNGQCKGAKYYVLQVEKNYAKVVKDLLKKNLWLDLSRKVQTTADNCNIHFPVIEKFHSLVLKQQTTSVNGEFGDIDIYNLHDAVMKNDLSLTNVSQSNALAILLSFGGSLVTDDIACIKKEYKSPKRTMRELVFSLLEQKGMPLQLLDQLPTRWERLGDIVVFPKNSFNDPSWDSIGEELWPAVAKALGTQRLARQGQIAPTGTRDSTLEILLGGNGWVDHQENGIIYSFDATKCMFSFGNLSEKLRISQLDCADEVVVDLFAGIGYFVLPFLVRARAKLVYACEWNPHALKALEHNIHANSVADRCVILEGDNRLTAPKEVADRVCLGLLPSSECSWDVAVRALRPEGGILHVHGNVNDTDEDSWLEYVVKTLSNMALSEGRNWSVSVQHVERVKWYGPHIRHLVADVRCK